MRPPPAKCDARKGWLHPRLDTLSRSTPPVRAQHGSTNFDALQFQNGWMQTFSLAASLAAGGEAGAGCGRGSSQRWPVRPLFLWWPELEPEGSLGFGKGSRWSYIWCPLLQRAAMRAVTGSFLRRAEHRLVDMVMAALALVLERLVVRSIGRAAKRGTPRGSHR